MDESRLRQMVCQAAYQLWARGLITGGAGAVSVELFRRRFLITPAKGRRPELQPQQIICVDMGGMNVQAGGGLPEPAWRPHRAGYKLNLAEPGALMETGPRRRTIAATILAEPPILMALLRLQPETDHLELGDVTLPVRKLDDENDIASALRISPGVAIRGVGLLCAEADLATALNWVERIDYLARVELASGSPNAPPPPEVPPEAPPASDGEPGDSLEARLDAPRIPTHDAATQAPDLRE